MCASVADGGAADGTINLLPGPIHRACGARKAPVVQLETPTRVLHAVRGFSDQIRLVDNLSLGGTLPRVDPTRCREMLAVLFFSCRIRGRAIPLVHLKPQRQRSRGLSKNAILFNCANYALSLCKLA
jgi:hypothetical protein